MSVGGSYDYPSLGCTHHCPADVVLINTIPNMEIFFPATNFDLNYIMWQYHGDVPMYVRLTERPCEERVLKYKDCKNVVLACGDTVDRVAEATKDMDVCVLDWWGTTQYPGFPPKMENLAMVEPFYEGTLYSMFSSFNYINVLSIGVPKSFQSYYGSREAHDKWCELDVESIKLRLKQFFNE